MADATARIKINVDNAEAEAALDSIDDKAKKTADSISAEFTKAGAAITAIGAVGVAAVINLAQGAMEGEVAMAQLNHAIIDVSGGTSETVKAFEELAVQLQENGVLNKDAIITGQAQLSTFGLSTDAVYNLTASMADLAVNQFGVSATSEDLTATANMMQKALQGQFGILEKSGIRFTEAQQEMILYGTEMEKVSAINEGFAQNLKFTNEVAMQTFSGQLENLKNKFGEAIGPLEDAMLPALETLAGLLSRVADFIGGLSPETLEMIGYFLLFATAAAAIIGPMLLFVAVIGAVVAAFNPVTIGIALIIAGLTALGALVTIVVAQWDEFKAAILEIMPVVSEKIHTTFQAISDFLNTTMDGIISFFETAWNSIKDTVSSVLDTIIGIFETFWGYVSPIFEFALMSLDMLISGDFTAMQEFILSIWTGIKDFFSATWETLKSIFSTSLTSISNTFKSIWTGIKTFFTDIWDGMKSLVSSSFETIVSTIMGFLDPIKAAFQTIWDAAVGVVTGAVDTVMTTIKDMINGIISMVNKAIGGINSMAAAASVIPGVSIPQIPDIPYLAEGGVVTSPTLAMIGEGDGPEAVIPLDKYRGGIGGGEIHFHFEGPVSSKEVAMEYADLIVREYGLSNKMV